MENVRADFALIVLMALVLMGCTGSCSSNNSGNGQRPEGVIFGWDNRGIAVVDLKTGRRTDLVLQQEGPRALADLFGPATVDPINGTLYYVHGKTRSILRLGRDEHVPTVLYKYEEKVDISWLEMEGNLVTFCVQKWNPAPDSPSAIVVLETGSGAVRRLVPIPVGTFAGGMLTAHECLVATALSGTTGPGLRALDLESGKIKPLGAHVPSGALLPGKKEVLVTSAIGSNVHYAVYELGTGKKLRDVSDKLLPGRGIGPTVSICPISRDFAAVGRETDPMNPLGTYLLDLRSGGARKLTDSMLRDPQYISHWVTGNVKGTTR